MTRAFPPAWVDTGWQGVIRERRVLASCRIGNYAAMLPLLRSLSKVEANPSARKSMTLEGRALCSMVPIHNLPVNPSHRQGAARPHSYF